MLASSLFGWWSCRKRSYGEEARDFFLSLRQGDFEGFKAYLEPWTCHTYGISEAQLKELFDQYLVPSYGQGKIQIVEVTSVGFSGQGTVSVSYTFPSSRDPYVFGVQLYLTDTGLRIPLQTVIGGAWTLQSASEGNRNFGSFKVIAAIAKRDQSVLESLGIKRLCPTEQACYSWPQSIKSLEEH